MAFGFLGRKTLDEQSAMSVWGKRLGKTTMHCTTYNTVGEKAWNMDNTLYNSLYGVLWADENDRTRPLIILRGKGTRILNPKGSKHRGRRLQVQ